MPKVGKKHFPYTKAGKKRAEKVAKKRGLKVKGSKNPGYYMSESIWDTYRSMAYLISDEVTSGEHKGRKWTVKRGAEISQDPKERQRLALQNRLDNAKTKDARAAIQRQLDNL